MPMACPLTIMGNPWRQVQWTDIVKVWLRKGTGTSYLPSEPTPSNLLAYYQQTQWTRPATSKFDFT